MADEQTDKTDLTEKVEKKTIVLHQFPRTKKCPSHSPFPIKMETFFRMNKLTYTSDFKNFMGKKGKCPWMTDDDGTEVCDSQFMIEYLIKKHNIEMLKLSPEDEAVARSMRILLEDNFYFALLTDSVINGTLQDMRNIFPRFVPPSAPNCLQTMVLRRIKSNLGKQAVAQGIGRHTREEARQIGISDLQAISDWLGSKPYMMGDAPHPVDCSVFGFLAILFYNGPEDNFFTKEAKERFPNLKAYVDRIKSEFWPDWDELLVK